MCYVVDIVIRDFVIREVRISEAYSQLRLCNVEELKQYMVNVGEHG